MKMAVMDLSYNNTSMYVNLVEVYLLPVNRPFVSCVSDGSRVHAPRIHVAKILEAIWGAELNDNCSC